jgi:hypothetical protein
MSMAAKTEGARSTNQRNESELAKGSAEPLEEEEEGVDVPFEREKHTMYGVRISSQKVTMSIRATQMRRGSSYGWKKIEWRRSPSALLRRLERVRRRLALAASRCSRCSTSSLLDEPSIVNPGSACVAARVSI